MPSTPRIDRTKRDYVVKLLNRTIGMLQPADLKLDDLTEARYVGDIALAKLNELIQEIEAADVS